MPHLLRIHDSENGAIEVSWQTGGALLRSSGPLPFTNPLAAADRAELQWYLEEYLDFPYGAESYRAQKVERQMEEWGEALFRQAFEQGDPRTGPPVFYQEAVREGLGQCEICISSARADFMSIPWELLYDPSPGRGFLAMHLAGLFRQWSGQKVEVPPALPEGGAFRILLVIARPYGEKDVPLGTVARPVLEAVRPLRPRIELEVLRPPTFDALTSRLADRPGHFHLVHFDGHGVFAGPSPGPGAPPRYAAMAGQGHLAFETIDGKEHIVNSRDLGQALASCRVPLFVLNACQSAVEGNDDAFSSVASQLVAIGARGVVAMNHSVYAETAAAFMGRFYERLIGNAPLAQAVAAARQTLFANPTRGSVAGPLELRDWMVPSLYQQETEFVPIPRAAPPASGAEEEQRKEETGAVLRQKAEEDCPEGQYGFIGRDGDIQRIERAWRDPNTLAVLLTGLGGIGKTELAFGFARWFAETGGCPGGVFAASFKTKADLGEVIGGIMGHGTDFSRLPDEQQWRALVGYLRDNPCLLVWDNFETAAGYPGPSDALASGEDRDKLRRFLLALRGGKSRVLITTRKPDEEWLRVPRERIELRGLNRHDAARMAERVLKTVGRRPEDFRSDPQYSELVNLLRGHPRSLEIVLPQLARKSPGEIIHALQHRIGQLGESLEDASLVYAFSLLSDRARRHLPFLGLFASFVHAGTLGAFVGSGGDREKTYRELLGESLNAEGWESVLEEAARNAFVRGLGSRIYELHPTLPVFLRRRLAEAVGQEGVDRLDGEFLRFYAGWAGAVFEKAKQADRNALTALTVEENNLLRAVRLAEMTQEWARAQDILQTLNQFYSARGRADEWRAVRSRFLQSTGREMAPAADNDRADLWMFLLNNEANDALLRNDLNEAEESYRRVLEYLESLKDPAVEPKIAVGRHQLGTVAEERQRFDEAERWYRQALEIRERLGLERDAAYDYHQLGIVAQMRQRFDEAEQWYRKALEIRERLGLERYAAPDYHQLGIVAQERQRLDEAEQWHRKALEIRERLGLERDAASDYHQLGIVAHERQRFDEAEQWHRMALEIYERLGRERDAADEYHQLGMVAQERQRFDEAEQWYRKALEIFERLRHPPLRVDTLAQMGVLRRIQDRPVEAVAWFGRAFAIASEYNMSVLDVVLVNLALVLKAMGPKAFVRAWKEQFPAQAPPMDALNEIAKRLRSGGI